MGFAKKMQGVATKLLTKYDEAPGRIALLRTGVPVWDEDLAEMVPGLVETVPLVGVTVPFSASLVDNTTIQAGDVQAIVTAAEAPKADDKLLIDGVQWSIVGQPLIQYTGLAICYKIHARK